MTIPARCLAVRTLVKSSGELEVALVDVDLPVPAEDEVLVQVEASPVNPSDQGLLFAVADLATAQPGGTSHRPVLTARIPPERMASVEGRVGQPLRVGNEGAGTVVAAGSSPAAQALTGRRVAVFGGGLYAEFCCVKAGQCMALPDGTPFADGASCFINPLTALGMIETMRSEGHRALVHTAAASNLGQMLVRICEEDGIPLVAVVRAAEQEALLRSLGVRHVCSTDAPDFMAALTDAIAATDATLAFDAIGGGTLAGQILAAMEAALARTGTAYSRYGTSVHKQVYVYGSLDPSPTVIRRTFGLAWGVGGWLLWPFLQRIGPQRTSELKARIVAGLHSTFRSHYAGELSLAELLDPAQIARYAKRATGEKYLVRPRKAAAG